MLLSIHRWSCFWLARSKSIRFASFSNQYFIHQKLVELNIAIPIIVKVLEDGLHVSHVDNVVIVLVFGHLEDEPGHKIGKISVDLMLITL